MTTTTTTTTTIRITLELGGGTEFLTATKKTKKHALQVPALVVPNEFVKETQTAAVVEGALIATAEPAAEGMLVEPDWSLRPGILVLINDADWELEGEMEYELQDGDHICLISTLHGG